MCHKIPTTACVPYTVALRDKFGACVRLRKAKVLDLTTPYYSNEDCRRRGKTDGVYNLP